MKPTKDVVAVCKDFGGFIHVARRLARDVKKVYYTGAWESSFVRVSEMVIGDGYPELEWVESIFEVLPKCDLAVYPDIGFADEQEFIANNTGVAVWGCRNADDIESKRGLFLNLLEETGLPVPPHRVIKGITNLRLFLDDKEDKFIKVSTFRGDFETCHWRDMDRDENILNGWSMKLGPLRETINFYVFDNLDTPVEGGVDTWCIDGKWPDTVMQGFESKNKAYLMTFRDRKDVPESIWSANEAFGPVLAGYGFRGMFSTEVRVTEDGEGYFIDPTPRFASPVSQVQVDMIKNYGDIIWGGANGEVVEPEIASPFGAQILFDVPRHKWNIYDIPKELEPHVKVSQSCMENGHICVPPEYCEPADMNDVIGWVTATGDTIKESISNLKEIAANLPKEIYCDFEPFKDLLNEAKEAESMDAGFTDQPIPSEAIV